MGETIPGSSRRLVLTISCFASLGVFLFVSLDPLSASLGSSTLPKKSPRDADDHGVLRLAGL